MLDGNTIVHVLGTIDERDNMWDFSEVCPLDESFNIAIKQFKKIEKNISIVKNLTIL